MKGCRSAGVLVLCLAIAVGSVSSIAAAGDEAVVPAATDAPLFRIFLKDGTSLVSYGELARVEDRVVFSMPTSAVASNPQLHLITISAERVDWPRTVNYAESARASRYFATRAETDYALLTSRIEQTLNEVALTTDAQRRLTIVEGARRMLADWPGSHYNYKADEIRPMLTMLDEAIADLRAATGAQRFDIALVAAVEPPKRVPLLPPPTPKEVIEETLAAAKLADTASERSSLLTVAMASLERDAAALPAEWVASIKVSTTAAIAREAQVDRAYRSMSTRILQIAGDRAKLADVHGIQQLMTQVKAEDKVLGATRPDEVVSLLAAVEERLDAARRLRLERDRWALRMPEIRAYRTAVSPLLRSLEAIEANLEDIKTLAGSGPEALGAILKATDQILKTVSTIKPPDELREAHGLLVSATQLAGNAARIRREAALTANMTRAWDASSAAAGSLMLSAKAQTDMQNLFRSPQLPR